MNSHTLARLATLAIDGRGQPEIGEEDLMRTVAVTACIEGRDLGSAMADVI